MPVISKEIVFNLSFTDSSGTGTLTRTSTITPRHNDDLDVHRVGPITPHYTMLPIPISGSIDEILPEPTDRLRVNDGAVIVDPPLKAGELYTYEVRSNVTMDPKQGGFLWQAKIPTEKVSFQIESPGQQLYWFASCLSVNEDRPLTPMNHDGMIVIDCDNPPDGSMVLVYWKSLEADALPL